jgi:peptidoglycan hydrolase-like protein with peptidoglycan-binding domain
MHLRLCLIALTLAAVAHADELTKSVQNSLKDQGFFYGEVTGVNGPETATAVKRYQIRNGLEVTGTITKETLEALGVGGESPTPSTVPPPPKSTKAPPPTAAPVQRDNRTPNNLRKDDTVQRSDRDFLNRQQPGTSIPIEPPANLPPSGGGAYAHLFAQTPFASAPLEVQQSAIKQAQRYLQKLDMYDDSVDGQPNPALEEGILQYQRFIRLPLTGQLDLETLAAMRLLPGRGSVPSRSERPSVRMVPGSKPLRGVWIQ